MQPGPTPVRLRPRRGTRRKLRAATRTRRGPGADIGFRARLILGLVEDPCVSRVAARFGVSRSTVRRWRDRFRARGIRGLKDDDRPGRPVAVTAEQRCEIIGLACDEPGHYGVAFRQLWTIDSLLEVVQQLQTSRGERTVSRTTLIRVLNDADLRPHRMQLWLHSPDPRFRPLVAEICDLYRNPPKGSTVLCVDEKTGMQALGRKHPGRRPTRGRDGRFEFEYIRHGTRKLLCAFNPHTGDVYGEMREHRKAKDLVEFMEEIARRYPRGPIHIIWDNLNIHYDGKDARWTRFNERQGGRFHFHYTPIHASWVNQVELFFSFVHRRVIRHRAYNSLEELDRATLGFIDHWNRHERRTFNWTFDGYPLRLKRAA